LRVGSFLIGFIGLQVNKLSERRTIKVAEAEGGEIKVIWKV